MPASTKGEEGDTETAICVSVTVTEPVMLELVMLVAVIVTCAGLGSILVA